MKTLARVVIASLTALALSGCMRLYANNTIYGDATVSGDVTFGFSDSFIALSGEDPDSFVSSMTESPDFAELEAQLAQVGSTLVIEDYREDGFTGFTMSISRTSIDQLNLLNAQSGGGPVEVTREGDYLVYHQDGFEAGVPTGDPSVDALLEDPAIFDSIETLTTVTFPGDVISSSVGTIDGATVTYTLQDLLEGGDIDIKAWAVPHSSGLPTVAIVCIGAGLLLVGVAVAMAAAKRRRESEPLDPITPPPPIMPAA